MKKWTFIYKNSTNYPRKNDGKDMMVVETEEDAENSEGEAGSENESESGSESEGERTAESDEKDDKSDEDPTEVILIEQEMEFLPEIWYRVVIEFKEFKFRV